MPKANQTGKRFIFVGSSGAAREHQLVERVVKAIKSIGAVPMPWFSEKVFPPADSTWDSLVKASRAMHGAVFVFRSDDLVYPNWNLTSVPRRIVAHKSVWRTRDNVVLEFGLFAGVLAKHGGHPCCICRDGNTELPTDLQGITYVSFALTEKEFRGRLHKWIEQLRPVHEYTFLSDLELRAIYLNLRAKGISFERSKEILVRLGVSEKFIDIELADLPNSSLTPAQE